MRDGYHCLQNQKTAAQHGDVCYLQDTYDTYGYHPVFTDKNPLAMIRNTAIEAFNSHLKMPNAIVIIAGTDLITQDPLFLPSEIDKKIRWIIREIMAAVECRKSNLKPKNFTFGEPRIMWVRACQVKTGDPVPWENITKFNNILYRICAGKAIYTPELSSFAASTTRLYDRTGRINESAFKEYWLAISEAIKAVDQKDEQYFISKKVEDRLKELRDEDHLRFERKASTYLAVTDSKSFVEAARKKPKYQDNNGRRYRHDGYHHDNYHHDRGDRSRSSHTHPHRSRYH